VAVSVLGLLSEYTRGRRPFLFGPAGTASGDNGQRGHRGHNTIYFSACPGSGYGFLKRPDGATEEQRLGPAVTQYYLFLDLARVRIRFSQTPRWGYGKTEAGDGRGRPTTGLRTVATIKRPCRGCGNGQPCRVVAAATVLRAGSSWGRHPDHPFLESAAGTIDSSHAAQARGWRHGAAPHSSFSEPRTGRLNRRSDAPMGLRKNRGWGWARAAYHGLAHRGYYQAPRSGLR